MIGEEDEPPLWDDDPDGGPLPPEMPNAGDRRQQRKRLKKEDAAQRKGDEVWRGVLSTDAGRREIWAFLMEARLFGSPFAAGPNGFPQPEATWFNAGIREHALGFYHKLMRIDRAGVSLMHDENDPTYAKPKAPRTTPEDDPTR